MKAVLDGILTIGFTSIALYLFWKLLPRRIQFMCGVGLILVFLYLVRSVFFSDEPEPGRRAMEQGHEAPLVERGLPPRPDALVEIPATYSLASTVKP